MPISFGTSKFRGLFLIGFLLLASCPLFADSIVIFSTATNGCLRFIPSQDPTPYISRVDAMIFNDQTSQTEDQVRILISTTPIRYFKKVGSPQISHMTPAESAAVDAAIALARTLSQREGAKNIYDNAVYFGKVLRAIVLLVLDEINDLRTRDRDRAADVAAATSLADLKTRWAARSSLTDRTAAQARTAIRNKIDSGSAD